MPSLLAHTITNAPDSPTKVFCFNYGVDEGGQLTNSMNTLATRAFEWIQGEATKVKIELKYSLGNPAPDLDLTTGQRRSCELASGLKRLVSGRQRPSQQRNR